MADPLLNSPDQVVKKESHRENEKSKDLKLVKKVDFS